MNGAEILGESLVRNGVGCVFGIAGREAATLAFGPTGPRFVLMRDERGASLAADAYGRLSGSVGACYSTFGPGTTNMLTGIASAFLDRSPVVAISAQVESWQAHPHAHQYVDQVRIYQPVTKGAFHVDRAGDIPGVVEEAVRLAMVSPQGPVLVSIPTELFGSSVRDHPRARRKPKQEQENVASAAALNTVRRRLLQTDAVVLVLGMETARMAHPESLLRFLNVYSPAVACTYAAKGTVSSGDPRFLGTLSRYVDVVHRKGTLDRMFGSAECVLALGIDRAEDVDSSLWRRGNPKSIIYVQSLEPPADSAEADACIHMSVDDFCSRMLDSVRGARDASWAADVVARVQKAKERSAGSQRSCAPSLGRVDPLALVAFLKELLRPSDIVVADVGIHKHVLGILHECPRPKTFVCSSGLGVMGFALPAAIGAHFAIPKRRIVVVAGDGGFHSTSQELETASRFRVPLLVIVWKDGAFGLIRRYQELGAARRTPGMWRFGDVDFVKLAEANGCRGFRANSLPELREAFAKCNRANLPAVIEVPVDYRQFYGGD